MKISVYYSSITGNTRKLAEYISKYLTIAGHRTQLLDSARLAGTDPDPSDTEAGPDISILAFWCRRSCMDDVSKALLASWKGRRVIAMGTIGGDVTGSYGDRVRGNVREVIEEENLCLGVELCQGAVNLKRVEGRRQLPRESRHYVSPEKYERFLRTQGHPDQEDLDRQAAFVDRILHELTGFTDLTKTGIL